MLTADDVAALHAAHERSVLPLLAASDGAPALHGDANVHNLVATPDGFRWADFEDTARRPRGLGPRCAARRPNGRDRDALLPRLRRPGRPRRARRAHVAAREVQGLVWLLLVGTRHPDRAEEGRRRLAALRR